MRQFWKRVLVATAFAASMAVSSMAGASDWPATNGDFMDVTGVKFKPGGALAYMQFLAKDWKAQQEFGKSKGWIKSYSVMSNVYPRAGEADIYLVVVYERVPTGAEQDKRGDEFLEWQKKTNAQLVKEGGDRGQYREILSNELLQELKLK
jgi:hypothetical protein